MTKIHYKVQKKNVSHSFTVSRKRLLVPSCKVVKEAKCSQASLSSIRNSAQVQLDLLANKTKLELDIVPSNMA